MISPDARILSFRGVRPVLSRQVFVAPGATLIGDVILGESSSVWYQTVVRGDVNFIRIGRRTNLQDLVMVHVTTDVHPVRIGNGVTVGHSAVVHGATVEDDCLIGMGAILLDGVRIGESSVVAAGTLVPPGVDVPPRSLVLGTPARVRRLLSAEELARNRASADHYVEYARLHAAELGLPREEE